MQKRSDSQKKVFNLWKTVFTFPFLLHQTGRIIIQSIEGLEESPGFWTKKQEQRWREDSWTEFSWEPTKRGLPCVGVEVDTPVIWVHGKCLIHNQMMCGRGSVACTQSAKGEGWSVVEWAEGRGFEFESEGG